MNAVVVIGDELHGAGFRLAGAEVRHPAPADLDAAFARALGSAALVVLSHRCAEALAPGVLQKATLRGTPAVVVMPDIREPEANLGFVRRIRAQLGIES